MQMVLFHQVIPITISGQTVEPECRYIGKNGYTSQFLADGYGVTLPISGTGNDVIPNQDSPLLGTTDDSIKGGLGKYFKAALTGTYDISTEDIYIEKDASAIKYILYVTSNGTPQVFFQVRDGTDTANVLSAALPNGRSFFSIFYRYGNYAQIYINGVLSGAAADISAVNSISNAAYFHVFASQVVATDPNFKPSSDLDNFSLYKKSSWLDSHLQPTFAASRAAEFIGTKALSSRSLEVPVVATRNSTAYLRKDTNGIAKLFQVGKNWTRIEDITDDAGIKKVCSNTEPLSKNIASHNEDLNNWAALNNVSIDSNNPNQAMRYEGKFFDGIIGNSGTGVRSVRGITTENPTANKYTIKLDIRRINIQ
jgi:hypothetical protein